jgi:DNA-directed RNA polymerase subunit RPC12/RpoP
VGKPPYGYTTARGADGKNRLVIDPQAAEALHTARRRILAGQSSRAIAVDLVELGLVTGGLTASTLIRRLRNPALLGWRVEEDKQGGLRRSKIVIGHDGHPIRLADPVFTDEEWKTLQDALDARGKNQPPRQPSGATKFRGVLKCVECGTNMIVHHTRNKHGEYAYLRCQGCKSGGLGSPHPQDVYDALVQRVLDSIGDLPVMKREYARGEESRKEVQRLEETIAVYMSGLEPGGRYTKTRFTQEQAERTLDKLIAELGAIDPDTTKDRWTEVAGGKTFREHWEEGGIDAMTHDLLRVGVVCEVSREKIPKVRAPRVQLRLIIPEDVRDRLLLREDSFADTF